MKKRQTFVKKPKSPNTTGPAVNYLAKKSAFLVTRLRVTIVDDVRYLLFIFLFRHFSLDTGRVENKRTNEQGRTNFSQRNVHRIVSYDNLFECLKGAVWLVESLFRSLLDWTTVAPSSGRLSKFFEISMITVTCFILRWYLSFRFSFQKVMPNFRRFNVIVNCDNSQKI